MLAITLSKKSGLFFKSSKLISEISSALTEELSIHRISYPSKAAILSLMIFLLSREMLVPSSMATSPPLLDLKY